MSRQSQYRLLAAALIAFIAALLWAIRVGATHETLSYAEWSYAYRIRIARGEATYPLRYWLQESAGKRGEEISRVGQFGHRDLHAAGYVRRECGWGEIIAWTGTDLHPRDASAYAVRGWLGSPDHRAILLGRWDAWGVGVSYRDGIWFVAAIFVDCPGWP